MKMKDVFDLQNNSEDILIFRDKIEKLLHEKNIDKKERYKTICK